MPRAKKSSSPREDLDPVLRKAYEAADKAIAADEETGGEDAPITEDEAPDPLPDEGEVRAIESITGEIVTGSTHYENYSLPLLPAEAQGEEKPLSDEERDDLIRLEGEVDRSLFRAALALKEIRDRRLYRDTHRNFKDYCRERFDFGSSYSFSLVNAATIFENIEKSPRRADFSLLPENPYQLRPLEKLKHDPLKQAEAWNLSVERSNGKQPTFKTVKETVDEVLVPRTAKENDPVAVLSEVEFSVIRSPSDPRLTGRKGYWGRIEDIDADGNVTVTLYDRTVENVPSSDLSPLRGTKKEARQREKLLQRLQTIHEGTSEADRGVRLLLHHFGTLKDSNLTPVEEDILRVLERRAKSGTKEKTDGEANEEAVEEGREDGRSDGIDHDFPSR